MKLIRFAISLMLFSGAAAQGAMTEEQIGRVQSIVSHWKCPAFAALPIVGTADPAPVPSVRPDPRLDQANALAAANEAAVGPCRFNESEERIEIQDSAFALSDAALTQCLAGAYAQARYRGVEADWLARLSEHEAWIIKGGEFTKVAVEARLEKPAARMLWASFASRELLVAARGADDGDVKAGRAVASTTRENTSSKPTGTETEVRDLLGLPN